VQYRQNIDHCVSEATDGPGLSRDRLSELTARLVPSLEDIKTGVQPEVQAILDETGDSSVLEALEPVAERYSEQFDDVVVLGTGGSSLGGRTLCNLAPPVVADADGVADRPRLHFMDNVDPESFENLFQSVEPTRTGFLVISKSGATMETMAQFLYCLDIFRRGVGEDRAPAHFTAVCEPGARPLRDLASSHSIEVLDHPAKVGGRFSVYSVTGMLPAMIAGLDVEAIREGAAAVVEQVIGGTAPENVPAATGAALTVGLAEDHNITQAVLMPYIDRLESLGKWYRQLWAESLGKDGKGTTPIDALGAVDQHSQLQLYLEGPKDKFFTIIQSDTPGRGGLIPADLAANGDLDYLAGKRLGDLLIAEQAATADVLAENGSPVRTISIDGLDEQALGALMMHFILETILAADLLGVSPFGQPAVERGKELARKYLAERDGS